MVGLMVICVRLSLYMGSSIGRLTISQPTTLTVSGLFFLSMEEEDKRELQLLSSQQSLPSSSCSSFHIQSLPSYRSLVSSSAEHHQFGAGPAAAVDLQLSISLRPIQAVPSNRVLADPICDVNDVKPDTSCVEALKWQAAEQIRLAAVEKAYADRVRELTRREMELAQSEFARARSMWQRASEEVERAEKMKERATRQRDSTCMEITCQSCRRRFKP